MSKEDLRTIEEQVMEFLRTLPILTSEQDRRVALSKSVLAWVRREVEKACSRCCRDGRVSVDDVFQEVVVKILTRPQQIRAKSEGEFKAWIRKTAINRCIDFRRRRAFSAEVGHDLVHEDSAEGRAVRQDLDLEAAELLCCISQHLSPEDRRLLELLAQAYRHSEIAEILKINEVTARQRAHRLRGEVAKLLELCDGGQADCAPATGKEAP